jgi:uncharacterized protein YecT (DUF1311 family)
LGDTEVMLKDEAIEGGQGEQLSLLWGVNPGMRFEMSPEISATLRNTGSTGSQEQTTTRNAPVDCRNPQTQQDMNFCMQQSYEATDRQLQQVYQQLHDRVNPEAQRQLAEAEEEWKHYRQAQCELESQPHAGGSVYPTAYYRCMERLTGDRMQQLQHQMSADL